MSVPKEFVISVIRFQFKGSTTGISLFLSSVWWLKGLYPQTLMASSQSAWIMDTRFQDNVLLQESITALEFLRVPNLLAILPPYTVVSLSQVTSSLSRLNPVKRYSSDVIDRGLLAKSSNRSKKRESLCVDWNCRAKCMLWQVAIHKCCIFGLYTCL